MISKEFILAGHAIFTIETPDKGHRTYKVTHVEKNDRWPAAWFVGLLTGPNNTDDYSYLGKLDDFTGQIKCSAKSCADQNSFAVRLPNRVLARIWANDHDAYTQHGYQTHHEGKCCRCGRTLTTPESVSLGIGPECHKKMTMV